jgi:eukaryotic-like serine/threonine-protein kinase
VAIPIRRLAAPLLRPPGVDGLLAAVPTRAALPAVVRNVRRVTTVVVDPAARVQMLGAAVEDDPALSAETLRLANAAVVACAGTGRVETVHQAILLLGFERVRDVAVGAAVFGMVDGDQPALAELVGSAVITAHHALAIAGHLRHPRPETAYLAGLLRNLGELAAARWLPDAHRAYRAALADGMAPSVAARATLGATRDELGTALARHWGLPNPFFDALGATSSHDVHPDAELALIARLAGRLTDAVYRAAIPAEAAWDAVHEAAERLRMPMPALHDAAAWAFDASVDALAALRPDLKLDAWRTRLVAALGDDFEPRDEPRAPRVTGAVSLSLAHHASEDDAHDAQAARAAAAERATADAVGLALDALLAAGYQRSAFVLFDPASRGLRVRYAQGEGAEYLGHRIDTPADASTPLGRAFVHAEDTVAPTRVAIAALDDPVLKRLRSVTMVWLPVTVTGTPIGVVFGDALRSGTLEPDADVAAVAARDALGRALEALRGAR